MTASSPTGLTSLSFGHRSAHWLIHSEKTKTHLSSVRFYPFAAAFTGRKSIYSYQLIHRQVTTGIHEHARYKLNLWLEKTATLVLILDEMGAEEGRGGGGVNSEEVKRKTCLWTIRDEDNADECSKKSEIGWVRSFFPSFCSGIGI